MIKPKKLSHEILGLLAVVGGLAVLVYGLLILCGLSIAHSVLEARAIELTLEQYAVLDSWVFSLSMLIAVLFFVVLFLFLLGERLRYLSDIMDGIRALQTGNQDHIVPLEGGNELTHLAEAVNYLAASQRAVKEKEKAIYEEKDLLIRTLSHDIRTPLTAILSATELLDAQTNLTAEDQSAYRALIRKKSLQIKELTDILLDGGKRNAEHFTDLRLLMAQMADEFEGELEDEFTLETALDLPAHLSGTFDVQELQRIFDNLISNIRKYADPAQPVTLSIALDIGTLVIRQENGIRTDTAPVESHEIGLRSIRRIAHNYGGRAAVQQADRRFAIAISFRDF